MPRISDHEAVMVYSLLKIDLQPTPKRKVYIWSRGNWAEINEKARSFCTFFTTSYNSDTPINQLWIEFKNFVHLFWILYSRNLLIITLTPG